MSPHGKSYQKISSVLEGGMVEWNFSNTRHGCLEKQNAPRNLGISPIPNNLPPFFISPNDTLITFQASQAKMFFSS
jgi:hypothetical protein